MAILSDAMLDRFRSRAGAYDRENRFPFEDFEELKKAGYLAALVPEQFGGKGLSLQEVAEEQKRLAAASAATALAVNMHLIWTGVALVLNRQSDHSLDFVLEEAARGELFALAISEAGNDLVLFGSQTQAVPLDDGGYEYTGTKIFTSLSPAWSRLAIFGMDSTSPDAPKLVHAVIERDAEGIQILDDWDTLGMRATSGNTTKLSKVRARADRVHRRIDPGPSSDPLILAIFANFEILLASVYTGIALRAVELAIESAKARTSSRAGGAPKSSDPDVRRRIAGAAMALDGIHPQLEKFAGQVDAGADLGDRWFRELVGLKVRAVSAAQYAVNQCVKASGGGAYFNRSELSRLYRDVLAGSFQPSNEDSALSTVALDILGPMT
ncbi:MAG: acyl-CoA/acyl-ACP dehydrogenase [Cryobacterium sp.]|nr:acyl-CoA/acyl-ACP dehydrogenase [Cryobacterium sp.]MCO5293779.1 acyl-CoA/acyl-ACP dehydrogenase [Homoserinimonas sp.]MCW5945189.1 acyl-CoA/acyl-ACP dehydrogenase [Cryobacterium sp.]